MKKILACILAAALMLAALSGCTKTPADGTTAAPDTQATEKATEAATEKATEAATEAATEKADDGQQDTEPAGGEDAGELMTIEIYGHQRPLQPGTEHHRSAGCGRPDLPDPCRDRKPRRHRDSGQGPVPGLPGERSDP